MLASKNTVNQPFAGLSLFLAIRVAQMAFFRHNVYIRGEGMGTHSNHLRETYENYNKHRYARRFDLH